MKLIEEIKRRKVLKTLGVYSAAAFIIIQISDIVFPQLLHQLSYNHIQY